MTSRSVFGGGDGDGDGGGGGLSLLFVDRSVETVLTGGTHAVGRTVLNVTDASGFTAGRPILIRGELYADVESVDLVANTITLPPPGLTVRKFNNSRVVQAPMLGVSATIPLPITDPQGLEVRFSFALEVTNSNDPGSNYSGRSAGAYYRSDVGGVAAWYQTDTHSGLQDAIANTYPVGLLHSRVTNLTFNSWSCEIDPATGILSLLQAATSVDRTPVVSEIAVLGG